MRLLCRHGFVLLFFCNDAKIMWHRNIFNAAEQTSKKNIVQFVQTPQTMHPPPAKVPRSRRISKLQICICVLCDDIVRKNDILQLCGVFIQRIFLILLLMSQFYNNSHLFFSGALNIVSLFIFHNTKTYFIYVLYIFFLYARGSLFILACVVYAVEYMFGYKQ